MVARLAPSIMSMEEIKAAIRPVVETLRPERVVLFGSYAYGVPTAESDVDLLVVLDTELPRDKAYARVARFLEPRPFPMDLFVYSRKEAEHALRTGQPLIREIFRKGRILYERERENGQKSPWWLEALMSASDDPMAWVSRAEEDFQGARISLRRKTPLTYLVCFCAQQCVEKYLKAALTALGKDVPRSHELVPLRDMLAPDGLNLPFTSGELTKLSEYAVAVRYPSQAQSVEAAHAAFAQAAAARRIVRAFLRRIGLGLETLGLRLRDFLLLQDPAPLFARLALVRRIGPDRGRKPVLPLIRPARVDQEP